MTAPTPGGDSATPQPTAEGTTGDEQVVITFAAWDYERQIYEPLATKFTEENPNSRS